MSPQEAAAIVGRFADAGGNFVDTASRYSGGQGERILGDWIRPDRDRGATVSLFVPSGSLVSACGTGGVDRSGRLRSAPAENRFRFQGSS